MDPSAEQVRIFGVDARRRRSSAGLSAAVVAERMSELLDRPIKHQSVSAWERGEYGPRDYETASALDAVLAAGGELAALLAGDGSAMSDRVEAVERSLTALEDRVAETDRKVDEILRRLGAG